MRPGAGRHARHRRDAAARHARRRQDDHRRQLPRAARRDAPGARPHHAPRRAEGEARRGGDGAGHLALPVGERDAVRRSRARQAGRRRRRGAAKKPLPLVGDEPKAKDDAAPSKRPIWFWPAIGGGARGASSPWRSSSASPSARPPHRRARRSTCRNALRRPRRRRRGGLHRRVVRLGHVAHARVGRQRGQREGDRLRHAVGEGAAPAGRAGPPRSRARSPRC